MKKPLKCLYFDVETTGTDPVKNDIIQLSGIVEWESDEVDRFNFRVKPFSMVRYQEQKAEIERQIKNLISFPNVDKESDEYKDQLASLNQKQDKIDAEFQDSIDTRALEVNGITIEQLREYPDPTLVFNNLTSLFHRHVNRYDSNDKFIPIGHNVQFDMNFLNAFFNKMGNPYMGAWLSWHTIDTIAIARYYFILNEVPIANFKLETLCKYFDISLDAHDSMNDIVATRELLLKLKELIGINKSRVW